MAEEKKEKKEKIKSFIFVKVPGGILAYKVDDSLLLVKSETSFNGVTQVGKCQLRLSGASEEFPAADLLKELGL